MYLELIANAVTRKYQKTSLERDSRNTLLAACRPDTGITIGDLRKQVLYNKSKPPPKRIKRK